MVAILLFVKRQCFTIAVQVLHFVFPWLPFIVLAWLLFRSAVPQIKLGAGVMELEVKVSSGMEAKQVCWVGKRHTYFVGVLITRAAGKTMACSLMFESLVCPWPCCVRLFYIQFIRAV